MIFFGIFVLYIFDLLVCPIWTTFIYRLRSLWSKAGKGWLIGGQLGRWSEEEENWSCTQIRPLPSDCNQIEIYSKYNQICKLVIGGSITSDWKVLWGRCKMWQLKLIHQMIKWSIRLWRDDQRCRHLINLWSMKPHLKAGATNQDNEPSWSAPGRPLFPDNRKCSSFHFLLSTDGHCDSETLLVKKYCQKIWNGCKGCKPLTSHA